MLETARWRTISWHRGTKARLSAHFAAMRVRAADGPTQRIRDMGAQHLPGEEVWVIGEHRSTGERKYYLSNLPADTPLKKLAAAIKARWVCEQAHQQLKEELGLEHFEGRSWTGLHRHALMTMIAYAFLQSRRLEQARGKKESQARRRSQLCPPCDRQSLTALRSRHRCAAPIATGSSSSIICQSSAKTYSIANVMKHLLPPTTRTPMFGLVPIRRRERAPRYP
jgi:SRSO17 transposase